MKPTTLKTCINTALDQNLSAFIWGASGIGKSQIVKQVADERGIDFIDFRALLHDVVDLQGIPSVSNGKTTWNTPDFLPTEGEGIFFLDELTSAPPAMLAALYQLVLDRKIGGYILPDGWKVIAAGNRTEDRGIVHKMPAPLANRFLHLDLECDLDNWCDWAFDNNLPIVLIAFLRFRSELLHQFDPKQNPRCFPSPRAWASVAKVMDNNLPHEVRYELYSGIVGEGPAAELLGFEKVFNELQGVDAILLDPAKASIPTDASTLYALCLALSKRADENNIAAVMTYCNRLSDEYSWFAVQNIIRINPQLQNTQSFIHWASKQTKTAA